MSLSNKPISGHEPGSLCPLCNSNGEFSFRSRDLFFKGTLIYQYMQCTHCGAVYQDPMPTQAEIEGFYPDDYSVYRKIRPPKRHGRAKFAVLRYKYGYNHLHVPRAFLLMASVLSLFRYRDSITYVPNGRALDIGCGNGKFIQAMNSLGWQFEGVEFNPVAVDACHEAGLKVFHGELQAAAYKDNSFDLITARHVIEHMPNPNNFMCEITRILKKKGRLVIETPNSQALGRRWFGTNWYANEVPRHLVLYNTDNLNSLAERHGMRRIKVKTPTTPKIILNSLDYLIGRKDKPSRKSKFLRLLSRPYVMLAAITGRGDIVLATYERS
ncbi:MAG: class I SAM-dependent methyltransferase [Deltaproteobacteria bacterium]|nr:class I SAM-dependent methyltransferase [Deltaproteobacteria bacterium]